jgi:TetR/AcrR family transcriptional repressor of nem operon
MAWNKDHKEKTKEQILISAASLFTRNGFEKISIDQVMKNAQLTRGAFYAHFSSKSDLYKQAMTKASVMAHQEQMHQCENNLQALSQRYLSEQHRDENLVMPCPLAALVTDINQRNDEVKDTYTEIFKGFMKQTKQLTSNNEKALQTAALMIGGLALSKALSDPSLSNDLLAACQQGIIAINQ